MKRLLVFITAFVLFAGCCSSAFARNFYCSSYQFDLTMTLNPEDSLSDHHLNIDGYAALLNNLRFIGTFAISDNRNYIDLNTTLVPVSRPSSSISFRIYGTRSSLLLSSPLIGNQNIALNMKVLLEFSVKAFQYLGIPVQYISMLYPNVHEYAFKRAAKVFRSYFTDLNVNGVMNESEICSFANTLQSAVDNNRSLYYWIEAVGIEQGFNETLHEEVSNISEYIIGHLTRENHLYIKKDGMSTVFFTDSGEILSILKNNRLISVNFSGPVTPGGHIPSLQYLFDKGENTDSSSGKISLINNEEELKLIDLSYSVDHLPHSFPAECSVEASFSQTGTILPVFKIDIMLTCDADGNIQINCSNSSDTEQVNQSFLAVFGSIYKEESSHMAEYTTKEFRKGFDLFAINDITLPQFINDVSRPLLKGILNFLEEIPVSSFQSIMNDLTYSGILKILLSE